MAITVIDRNFHGELSRDINDYPDGIVVVIDKPYRWTSADVIRKVKYTAIRHFRKKNLKVGHAGTLDPLATGVLLVCIGNACKQAQAFQATDKEYVAGVCFGATTPSYDLEKDIDRRMPYGNVSEQSLRSVLPSFIGEQDQVAPLFSAKQVDGVRAYELARKLYREGKTVDDAARELLQVNRINITGMVLETYGTSPGEDTGTADGNTASSAQVSGASSRINVAVLPPGLPVATIRVACSKGTYIRALARDLGEKLGTGAFLCSLQRSRCGEFLADDAMSTEDATGIFRCM